VLLILNVQLLINYQLSLLIHWKFVLQVVKVIFYAELGITEQQIQLALDVRYVILMLQQQ
jgi:hypothetical protein